MDVHHQIIWILLLTASSVFSQPDNETQKADLLFQKGLDAHQKTALDDAIGYYSTVLNRSPRHTGALYNRAMAYFSKQQYHRAAADLDAYLQLIPYDGEAYERRGNIAFLQKNYVLAEQCYTKVLTMAPSARLFVNRGIARLEAGNPRQAIEDFQQALQLDDTLMEAWLGMGNAWIQLRNFHKARSVLQEAVQHSHNDTKALFNLAILFGKLGKYEDGKLLFDLILSQQKSPAALAQRAYFEFKLGNFEKAKKDATEAHLLDVRLTYPYHTLGLLAMREEKWIQAEQFFSEGLSWNEKDAYLLSARGQAHYFMKNYTEALADLNRAIDYDAQVGESYYARASVHLMMGQRVLACQDYQTALQLGFDAFSDEDGSVFCDGVPDKTMPKK